MRLSARAIDRFPHQSVETARYASTASKMMLTYQAGLVSLQRFRAAEQRITLQYVNVGPNEQGGWHRSVS